MSFSCGYAAEIEHVPVPVCYAAEIEHVPVPVCLTL
jgi:hypothetical protein